MNITQLIDRLITGCIIVIAAVVCATWSGYTIPFSDQIVLGGGGILLVVIMLMATTFREGK